MERFTNLYFFEQYYKTLDLFPNDTPPPILLCHIYNDAKPFAVNLAVLHMSVRNTDISCSGTVTFCLGQQISLHHYPCDNILVLFSRQNECHRSRDPFPTSGCTELLLNIQLPFTFLVGPWVRGQLRSDHSKVENGPTTCRVQAF